MRGDGNRDLCPYRRPARSSMVDARDSEHPTWGHRATVPGRSWRDTSMGQPQASATKVDRVPPIIVGIDRTAANRDAIVWADEDLAHRSTDAGPRQLVMCRIYPLDTPAHCGVAVVEDTGGSS